VRQLAQHEVPGLLGELHLDPSTYFHHFGPGDGTRGGQGGQRGVKVFAAVCQHFLNLCSGARGIGQLVLAYKCSEDGFCDGSFHFVVLMVEDVIFGGIFDDVPRQHGGLLFVQEEGMLSHFPSGFFHRDVLVSPPDLSVREALLFLRGQVHKIFGFVSTYAVEDESIHQVQSEGLEL
jgi:hypothetical protein